MSSDRVEGVFEHEKESFGTFLYNKRDGTVMGRTGGSWGRIGFFYLVFYAFLSAWFSVMLAVFYQTLDTHTNPTYVPGIRKDGSAGGSILQNPAMGFMPLPRAKNVESTLIWYKQDKEEDVEYWVEALKTFMEPYEQTTGHHGQNMVMCNDAKDRNENQACIFTDKMLGEECQKKDNFGYLNGKPCVLLKMNKMINWVPEVYRNETELPKNMPQSLKDYIVKVTYEQNPPKVPEKVWVSCEGENPADREYIGPITMNPHPGFDAYYFPYRNTPGYLNPLVGVVFQKPVSHVLINIECRAWAKNIDHNRSKRLGLVHFELLLD